MAVTLHDYHPARQKFISSTAGAFGPNVLRVVPRMYWPKTKNRKTPLLHLSVHMAGPFDIVRFNVHQDANEVRYAFAANQSAHARAQQIYYAHLCCPAFRDACLAIFTNPPVPYKLPSVPKARKPSVKIRRFEFANDETGSEVCRVNETEGRWCLYTDVVRLVRRLVK